MKILNFGSCNIDYVYSLAHIVKVGETLNSHQLNIFPGGKGLNQSIALARAGAKVYHAGCVGENGDLLTDLLVENGVDISFLKKVEGMNGHAIIQVSSDGENSIFLHAGSNAMITKEQVDHVLAHFGKGDILVLQNEMNNLKYIARQAHDKGMCIVLNPSPINERIFEIDFHWLDYIILNEIEAKDLSGCDTHEKSLAYFGREYPQLKVMLTLGKNGCMYQDGQQTCYHPIFETEVVDTTAAGDTFTGYFVAGISQGKAVERILQEASCASAIAVSRMGAAPSIPTADEVMHALKTRKTKRSIRTERILGRIDQYMGENLSGATLEGLAAYLEYSTVYTGVLVKKLTGLTYKEYLQSKRLKAAAELIKNTEMAISDVIRKCGYENESYFRQIFRDRYKVNPLEYRNKEEKRG